MTRSALYDGWVRHRRFSPRPHDLRYRIFQPYLDLSEVEDLLRPWPLASARRPALVWFRAADHLSSAVHGAIPAVRSLDAALRTAVQQQTGKRPAGPIRVLTHLRCFGFVFNPVSFYFVYDAEDQRVQSIVAEVDNTPWGERHLYVLERGSQEDALCFEFDKAFHVSPFMPMQQRYRWRFTEPGRGLVIHMQSLEGQRVVFDATLSLRRAAWSRRGLARRVAVTPVVAAKVFGAIYWNALRLWLKGVPFYAHPGSAHRPSTARTAPTASGTSATPSESVAPQSPSPGAVP